jgi:hypothetical protein
MAEAAEAARLSVERVLLRNTLQRLLAVSKTRGCTGRMLSS